MFKSLKYILSSARKCLGRVSWRPNDILFFWWTFVKLFPIDFSWPKHGSRWRLRLGRVGGNVKNFEKFCYIPNFHDSNHKYDFLMLLYMYYDTYTGPWPQNQILLPKKHFFWASECKNPAIQPTMAIPALQMDQKSGSEVWKSEIFFEKSKFRFP